MAFRLYLVPAIGTGTKADPRRPKYFATDAAGAGQIGLVAGGFSAVEYGSEAWMIVGSDLSAADDAVIVGKADGMALPFDLTANLTGPQVTSVTNKLEAMNVPAGWVSTALTWTTVVRTVLGIFAFLQRYEARYAQLNATVPPSVFTGGVTLSSTFGSLPAGVQTAMTDAATSLGFSTAGLTAGTTLRIILKNLADQAAGRPYVIGGVSI